VSKAKEKKIGLLAASVIGINAMIGAGIFAMPAKLSAVVGPASVLSYFLSSLVILSIVFPLGYLALRYPGEGWGYRYPSQWGGHVLGMIASFSYIIGVIIAMGFLTQQLGVWVTQFISLPPQSIGVVLLGTITVLVLLGTQIASWGQYVIAACVLLPLLTVSITCWSYGRLSLLQPFMPYGVGSVFNALPVVLFSLFGFESITSLYAIVENPRKNVPLAAVIAVVTVVGMYMLFVSGALAVVAPIFFSGGVNQAFSEVLTTVLPHLKGMQILISIGAFFGIFGTLHSMIWSVGVLLFDTISKAKNNAVVSLVRTSWLSRRSCIALTSITTLICALGLHADSILELTPLFIVPVYMLSILALLFDSYERKRKHFLMAVFALLSSGMLTYIAAKNVIQTFFG